MAIQTSHPGHWYPVWHPLPGPGGQLERAGYALGTARLPVHIGHAGAVDCIQKASIQSYTYVSSKWGSFPCAPNRHQPNEKPITVRRGEGGEERRGGPLWSPASWSLCSPAGGTLTYIMAHI